MSTANLPHTIRTVSETMPRDTMRTMLARTTLAAAAMLAAAGLQSADAQSRPAAAPVTLIRNATVLTVTNGTLENTDVLLRDGKIAQVGQGLSAPSGARVIDASGKYVMPGIIDPHSHMMSDAINEGARSVTSMVRITDILDPTAVNIYRALAGGVTTINILHGSANTIGGQNATVKLKYGRDVPEMIFDGAPPGIKFALGENVTQKSRQEATRIRGGTLRYPATRMGQEQVLRDAFVRAQDYRQQWADYRVRAQKGEKGLVAPRRDLELEPLVEVMEGKRLVHAHGYRADELLMLLGVAEDFGFTVKTLQHGLEGYKIASEIAEHGAGLSTFADSWSYKIEAYDAIPHNAAILVNHGVLTTINSDSDERIRRLNVDAAKLMRYGGLTEEEALKTITYNGAVQLGVGDRVGSIEVGKDADVAIWSAHPLSVYSSAETVFIDGEIFFDKERDRQQRDQLARERSELERADAAAAGPQRAIVP